MFHFAGLVPPGSVASSLVLCFPEDRYQKMWFSAQELNLPDLRLQEQFRKGRISSRKQPDDGLLAQSCWMADREIRFAELERILESFGLGVGVGRSGGQKKGGRGSEAKIKGVARATGQPRVMRIGHHGRSSSRSRATFADRRLT